MTGLSLGRIGLGVVSIVKPQLVSSQLAPGPQPATPLLTQWFGSREIALGAATLLTRGGARRTLTLIGVAVDASDAATAYQAVQRGALPKPGGTAMVGIAGGAVVAGLLGLVGVRVGRRTRVTVS